MTHLFECPTCRAPFVAEDKGLIARRNGNCARCTKAQFLKSMGLPEGFLTRDPRAD